VFYQPVEHNVDVRLILGGDTVARDLTGGDGSEPQNLDQLRVRHVVRQVVLIPQHQQRDAGESRLVHQLHEFVLRNINILAVRRVDDIHNDIRTHSSSPHSADKPASTAAAFAQASSRHRRLLSGQAFAQHEREALLARIAELEKVLQEVRDRHNAELLPPHNISNPSDVEINDEMSAAWTAPVVEDDGCRSGYLSPPVSPPEASRPPLVGRPVPKEIEDAQSLTVLEHGSPTKPRLQVTSSTLLFAREGEASSSLTGSRGTYFDGDSGAASPTNA